MKFNFKVQTKKPTSPKTTTPKKKKFFQLNTQKNTHTIEKDESDILYLKNQMDSDGRKYVSSSELRHIAKGEIVERTETTSMSFGKKFHLGIEIFLKSQAFPLLLTKSQITSKSNPELLPYKNEGLEFFKHEEKHYLLTTPGDKEYLENMWGMFLIQQSNILYKGEHKVERSFYLPFSVVENTTKKIPALLKQVHEFVKKYKLSLKIRPDLLEYPVDFPELWTMDDWKQSSKLTVREQTHQAKYLGYTIQALIYSYVLFFHKDVEDSTELKVRFITFPKTKGKAKAVEYQMLNLFTQKESLGTTAIIEEWNDFVKNYESNIAWMLDDYIVFIKN